jgi:hypothetical protein
MTKHGMASHHIAPKDAKLWELSFRILRDTYWSNFWKKGKRSVLVTTFRHSTNFVVPFVKNVRRKKTAILQHDNARPHTACLTLQTIQKHDWGTALSSILYSGFGPLRLPLVRVLERSPERSPLRD